MAASSVSSAAVRIVERPETALASSEAKLMVGV